MKTADRSAVGTGGIMMDERERRTPPQRLAPKLLPERRRGLWRAQLRVMWRAQLPLTWRAQFPLLYLLPLLVMGCDWGAWMGALAMVSRTPKSVLLQHSAKTPVSRHG